MCVNNLLTYNFSVKIIQKRNINGCAGYLLADDPAREFCVAAEDPTFFDVFLHEYCHFLQFIENVPKWKDWLNGVDGFNQWLKGREYPKYQVRLFRRKIQEMELNCEKRAVRLVKKYKLPVELDKYVKMANAYLFSYILFEKFRKWPSAVYIDCWEECPSKLKPLSFYNKIENVGKEASALMLKKFA